MDDKWNEPLPEDVVDVARMLSDRRPRATALELDQIKLRAKRRAAGKARAELSRKGLMMRSRMVITALLVGGLLMLGGGAALGVSGLSSTRSASIAQYGTGTTGTTRTVTGVVTTTTGTTTTVTNNVTNTVTNTTTTEGNDVSPDEEENLGDNEEETPAGHGVQGARQVSAKELPFTGYLAIPVLVIGLAMLGVGLAMRRSGRRLGTLE